MKRAALNCDASSTAVLSSRSIYSMIYGWRNPSRYVLKGILNIFLDGKVQQLLTGIQSSDECQQLQAVMELCQV